MQNIIKPCLVAGKSKTFKIIAGVVGALIIALGIFAVGAKVGFRKAKYSCDWGKNYERNFMGSHFDGERGIIGSRQGFFGGMENFTRGFDGKDFRNAHGLAGAIISISENNLIIKDKDGKENTVAVSDKTIIKSQRDNLKITDLKQDDQVVVMGNPSDNGVVSAVLIRVFRNNATN